MAVTTDIQYLFPPNFVEGTDTMGNNQRKIAVRVTGVASDGTELTDDLVIDKSDLIGPDGKEPTSLVIEELEWSVSLFEAIILEWQNDSDQEIARLSGAGFKDYTSWGGLKTDDTGSTGDIILTTLGAEANASFDISIVARLKA